MKRKILVLGIASLLFTGCVTRYIEAYKNKNIIYPCTIGCGDKNITPPIGHVYYRGQIMTLQEFNQLINQNIVME